MFSIAKLLSIPGILLAISLHEAAHGYAAYLMGDRTAKYMGRLTLNPLRHLDLVGTLCMLLFGFGWAKPVPIDSRYFKNRRLGIVTVSLAGPLANFLLALVSVLLAGLLAEIHYPGAGFIFFKYLSHGAFIDIGASGVAEFVYMILIYCAMMNVGFMIFNLIPIPPLDGSKILLEFLPHKARYTIYRYERYFGIILIAFIVFGTLTPVLGTLQSYVFSFLGFLGGLIF